MHSSVSKSILILIGAAFLIALPFYATKQMRTAQNNASATDKNKQKIFNAEQYTLNNGMQIIVIPNNRAPVITHMVWYMTGAADEPRGKSGIAHFMEHLMFKGSNVIGGDTLKAGEFSEIIRSLGGNDNAFTSQDYTAYFQSIASEHLETVMRMEAGRMRGMSLPPEELDAERQVILEERSQRTDNNPQAKFYEQANAALFVNHPYGTPIIGWKHEIETLTHGAVKSFYDTWYAPNNALLVVSGDVTGPQVLDLAQRIYGAIPSVDLPRRTWTKSPPLYGNTTLTMHDDTLREASVQKALRVPSARQDKDTSLALQILENIMGDGSTSRLYKSLVVNQKIASNAGMSYAPGAWDDGVVWLYATPLPGVNPEDVMGAIENEVRIMIKNGLEDAEISEAKTRMMDAAVYARDSLTGPAMLIGRALSGGSTLNDIEYWPYDIESTTKGKIQSVAKMYLNPDVKTDTPTVTGYLLPKSNNANTASDVPVAKSNTEKVE